MLPRYLKNDLDKRKYQINTLKVFNDNVSEITEDTEYDVSFQVGGNNLVLRVILGNDFPSEKPVLSISPVINHPWVNEKGVVTSAPGLLNFTPHSDLGRVVQAIIRELQRNPQCLISNNASTSNIPVLDSDKRTSPHFSATFSFSPPNQVASFKNINGTTQTHKALMIPELNRLSIEELRFLNESEDKQAEFVDELPSIKDQNQLLDEMISQIEEMAEENVKRENQFHHLQNVVDSQIEEVAKLAFDNERLYTLYQDLSAKYSPRNIQEELGKAAKVAEEDSERIAESFLQGELDVDKFLNMFIKAKALYQLRKTKEEKLCQQLDHLEKAGF